MEGAAAEASRAEPSRAEPRATDTALLAATVASVAARRHLDAGQGFHQEINLWSFSNGAGDFFFYESCTVISENIIPAVYVAVIDLFMKTAIVLRSVGGSQTTEQLQVEVIVL